jgi:hypothetical protein
MHDDMDGPSAEQLHEMAEAHHRRATGLADGWATFADAIAVLLDAIPAVSLRAVQYVADDGLDAFLDVEAGQASPARILRWLGRVQSDADSITAAYRRAVRTAADRSAYTVAEAAAYEHPRNEVHGGAAGVRLHLAADGRMCPLCVGYLGELVDAGLASDAVEDYLDEQRERVCPCKSGCDYNVAEDRCSDRCRCDLGPKDPPVRQACPRPGCGREVLVNKDGSLRAHRRPLGRNPRYLGELCRDPETGRAHTIPLESKS